MRTFSEGEGEFSIPCEPSLKGRRVLHPVPTFLEAKEISTGFYSRFRLQKFHFEMHVTRSSLRDVVAYESWCCILVIRHRRGSSHENADDCVQGVDGGGHQGHSDGARCERLHRDARTNR